MFEILRTRLRQGSRTVPFPAEQPLPERFRGLPVLDRDAATEARDLPSALLTTGADCAARLDVGACLFCPEEAGPGPAGTVRFTSDYRLASSTREGLSTDGDVTERVQALNDAARRLFGRSLRLRSVVAGSCGGCEAELVALGNVVFDLARFGIQFVASPRHADGIVITGAYSRNMQVAVQSTYDATPAPKLVIAVGACAISGGPFRGSPEVGHSAPAGVPVDLWVPGCPPHPFTLLDGLLRLLGRLPERMAATAGSTANPVDSRAVGR
jgi:Ni,Fe-hydrogenase III small subunit